MVKKKSIWSRISYRVWLLSRDCRNHTVWFLCKTVLRRPPWIKDSFGHKFQPLSFSEYQYMRGGNPEVREEAAMRRFLKPGNTVIDVGGNHGLLTFVASKCVGPSGRVHTFEPTPSTFQQLKYHCEINNLNNVTLFPSAVGAEKGTAKLRVHYEETGLNTIAEKEITFQSKAVKADELVEVPVITLDSHCSEKKLDEIDLLKVDVEGFEIFVFRGGRKLFEDKKIKMMMFELSPEACVNLGVEQSELFDFLESVGYGAYEIGANGELGDRAQNRYQVSTNLLACCSH